MKRYVGNPHRRGGRLFIGCRPDLPNVGLSERGPDQDAGTSGEEPAQPEDEGIGTDDAPQGGGLDRALGPGPDPGQPRRDPEPRPGHPSTRQLNLDGVEESRGVANTASRLDGPPDRPASLAAVSFQEERTAPGPADCPAEASGRPHGGDPGPVRQGDRAGSRGRPGGRSTGHGARGGAAEIGRRVGSVETSRDAGPSAGGDLGPASRQARARTHSPSTRSATSSPASATLSRPLWSRTVNARDTPCCPTRARTGPGGGRSCWNARATR